jgi:hypothetical protein
MSGNDERPYCLDCNCNAIADMSFWLLYDGTNDIGWFLSDEYLNQNNFRKKHILLKRRFVAEFITHEALVERIKKLECAWCHKIIEKKSDIERCKHEIARIIAKEDFEYF